MKKEGKNIEVEDILNSLEGMQRAKPSDALFDKVLQNTVAKKAAKVISMPAVSVAAASILLLVAVNIAVLSNGHQKQKYDGDSVQQVVDYYGLTSNAFGL